MPGWTLPLPQRPLTPVPRPDYLDGSGGAMAGSGLAAPAPILAAMFALSDGLSEVRRHEHGQVTRGIYMDYGHELLFGTFITPAAQRPHRAVELAVVADRAGLDLVTFQDHPYQPGFLDTWTLLTYVAARTSRVRLSHNVLNLPLRPPVMLARAAASVDLLSGGRFELGIGAGRVWDATEAMGGPRTSRAVSSSPGSTTAPGERRADRPRRTTSGSGSGPGCHACFASSGGGRMAGPCRSACSCRGGRRRWPSPTA
jgi:hypothetical protein